MSFKNRYTLPAIVCICLLAACNTDKQQKAAIAETWNTYRNAIVNRNGAKAAAEIDSATATYYSEMLALVRQADSGTVDMLRSDQKFVVLSTRHMATPAQVHSFNGRSYYAYLVQIGMLDLSPVMDNVFGDIDIRGNKAQAKLVDTAKDVTLVFDFNKEGGQWKINFTDYYARHGQKVWDWLVSESDTTENALMYTVMESLNGKQPGTAVWQPVDALPANP